MSRGTCNVCKQIFSSESAFDMHRVGEFHRHGKVNQSHPTNSRRCMTNTEMLEKGMAQSGGAWVTRLQDTPIFTH